MRPSILDHFGGVLRVRPFVGGSRCVPGTLKHTVLNGSLGVSPISHSYRFGSSSNWNDHQKKGLALRYRVDAWWCMLFFWFLNFPGGIIASSTTSPGLPSSILAMWPPKTLINTSVPPGCAVFWGKLCSKNAKKYVIYVNVWVNIRFLYMSHGQNAPRPI